MPFTERYDVFLSMAKLLKKMGFYQRAELLLYEAMSYSNEPHDAHFQLGLLLLDKEDIERAKMHFKNCLFYRETDTILLVYLSTILLTEGKIYEAKFYITRLLSLLEIKITKLSKILDKDPQQLLSELTIQKTTQQNHQIFRNRIEDLMIKVFSCEYIFIPSATLETYSFYTSLLEWIQRNELNGRFLFDLGQSLYERGKPIIGLSMMVRGHQTSDKNAEGLVSVQVIQLRLAMEYPLIPDSLSQIIEIYLNMTQFLSVGASFPIEFENIIDSFWPLPLIWWSALPMAPVMEELLTNYFHTIPMRTDYTSQLWLSHHLSITTCLPQVSSKNLKRIDQNTLSIDDLNREKKFKSLEFQYGRIDPMSFRNVDIYRRHANHRNANLRDIGLPIEIGLLFFPHILKFSGILGGHFNGHAVGQYILHRFLRNLNTQKRFAITLIALPLMPDYVTSRIARYVDRIVNLPADTTQAWVLLEKIQLDILLFPDWQPFPDQQSVFFQSTRIAPVQVFSR
jgi:tetratricopeptide (TPR) repeat protein